MNGYRETLLGKRARRLKLHGIEDVRRAQRYFAMHISDKVNFLHLLKRINPNRFIWSSELLMLLTLSNTTHVLNQGDKSIAPFSLRIDGQ